MKKITEYGAISRKPIRNKELGCFAEWRLHRRGKKDCKRKILRKNENEQYTSPFLKQEISLCLSTIQNEKEMLAEIIMIVQSEIEAAQLRINGKNQQVSGIDLSQNPPDEATPIRLNGEEALTDNIILSYRTSEYNARTTAKLKQVESLRKSIESIAIEEQKYILLIEKEIEVTQLRCKQLSEILIARLSAYWTGVLSGDINSQNIPPLFNIDNMLVDINSQLECFNERRR